MRPDVNRRFVAVAAIPDRLLQGGYPGAAFPAGL